jgi:hypothetical protein
MNCRREAVKMAVPPGNPAVPRDWTRGVLSQYVAGSDARGPPEGRSYPRSQQAIHETSGLPNAPKKNQPHIETGFFIFRAIATCLASG